MLRNGEVKRNSQSTLSEVSLMTTSLAPVFATEATPSWNQDAGPLRFFCRINENTTSSAVSGVPSENLILGLISNV